MSLRCRGPSGVFSIAGLSAEQSVLSLCEEICQKSGIQLHSMEILAGYPPKPLRVRDAGMTSLAAAGIVLGDSLTIRQSSNPSLIATSESHTTLSQDAPQQSPQTNTSSPHQIDDTAISTSTISSQSNPSTEGVRFSAGTSLPGGKAAGKGLDSSKQTEQISIHASAESPSLAQGASRNQQTTPPGQAGPQDDPEDAELAKALALSLTDSLAGTTSQSGRQSSSAGASSTMNRNSEAAHATANQGAPVEVPVGDGTFLTRRTIDSDNSCLFNAVGYVMDRSRKRSKHLRDVIAKVVRADPESYSEAFLGKTNQAYCEWIQNPQKWGGAIELSILSRYYRRQIAAYDIHTRRMDLYGEEEDYTERAMLIYDGLHYDALAVSVFNDAPEDLDITIFDVNSSDLPVIAQATAQLVQKAHAARQFTDTGSFTLRCGTCQVGLKGEKEAIAHATKTGHQNFQEY